MGRRRAAHNASLTTCPFKMRSFGEVGSRVDHWATVFAKATKFVALLALCEMATLAGHSADNEKQLKGSPGPVNDEIVTMEKFMVTATRIGPRWRYTSLPGYEILSQCDDRSTNQYLRALLRGESVMKLELPHDCLASAIRTSVILFDAFTISNLTSSAIPKSVVTSNEGVLWGQSWRGRSPEQTRVVDVDTMVDCWSLGEARYVDSEGRITNVVPFHVTPTYRFRLLKRVPVFPEWLI